MGVGEAFVSEPTKPKCDGTAANCVLGPAEIDPTITSSNVNVAKGAMSDVADEMSDVVSGGGDMTAMSSTADGSSSSGGGASVTNAYLTTVAVATIAAVGVVALL